MQLIDAKTGNHLWAERFNKAVADLFDMQDEIVSRLANALDAQLIAVEAQRAERSLNPDAMDLFFQGRAWFNKGRRLNDDKSADFLSTSFDAGPRKHRGDARLGDGRCDSWGCGYGRRQAGAICERRGKVDQGVVARTEQPVAHRYLGLVFMLTRRPAQGIAECEQALALDRNSAGAHGLIGYAKYLLGRGGETEHHINEAFRLSPRDTLAHIWMLWTGLGKSQLNVGIEAVAWMRRGLELNRNFSSAHFHLAAELALLGELDQARAAAQAGLALDPGFTIRRFRAGTATDDPIYLAGRERSYEGLRRAGVPEG